MELHDTGKFYAGSATHVCTVFIAAELTAQTLNFVIDTELTASKL